MNRIAMLVLFIVNLAGCQTPPAEQGADASPSYRREDVTGSNIGRRVVRRAPTDEELQEARETLEGMRDDQTRRNLPRPK
ncbi:hypothetical protein HZ992_21195 [Rhizobacter sp. AJA081-3]|uniref:hypothetical protein n=1 Tax=Rhizobacter sp. AJA081-3 TaxID=2753607 RepID=UPI001ADF23EB|nr:hypothetical protein [Rhizobacter sp. AJA081-3]QTN22627.1 hypothetical protein HZ992_21195 [Rhizobacter sp. AJA081-3]